MVTQLQSLCARVCLCSLLLERALGSTGSGEESCWQQFEHDRRLGWLASESKDDASQVNFIQSRVEEVHKVRRGEADSLAETKSAENYSIAFHGVGVPEDLYKGCDHDPKLIKGVRTPDLLVIGVQKGGTSTFRRNFRKHVQACSSLDHEIHLFDSWCFRDAPPTQAQMSRYAYNWKFNCKKDDIWYEKTPWYYHQPWAPQRICESLGTQQKMVIFLRNPLPRSYSSFYQDARLIKHHLPLDREGFDRLVNVEVDIVKSCYSPPASTTQPFSLMDKDRLRTCCQQVASQHNLQGMPLCSCEGERDKDYYCTGVGDTRAMQVRSGLYVGHLLQVYTYHTSENVLVIRSEDLYEEERAVYKDIARFLGRSFQIKLPASHAQSNDKHTSHQEATEVPMLNETSQTLQTFYRPWNQQLETLLGRKMNW